MLRPRYISAKYMGTRQIMRIELILSRESPNSWIVLNSSSRSISINCTSSGIPTSSALLLSSAQLLCKSGSYSISRSSPVMDLVSLSIWSLTFSKTVPSGSPFRLFRESIPLLLEYANPSLSSAHSFLSQNSWSKVLSLRILETKNTTPKSPIE